MAQSFMCVATMFNRIEMNVVHVLREVLIDAARAQLHRSNGEGSAMGLVQQAYRPRRCLVSDKEGPGFRFRSIRATLVSRCHTSN